MLKMLTCLIDQMVKLAFCFRHRQGLELLQHVHCSFVAALCDNGMQDGY